MAETTAIEWCDATWSPWEGCTKVSPGCDHCYAERMNRWLKAGANWGPGAPRREFSQAHWDKPLRWNAKAEREGRQLRVFPSVCDPFDNEVDPQWRAQFFTLIAGTPNLTWLLLTKRIGNVKAMLPGDWGTVGYANVWLGATVVNQEEADRDVPKLIAVPARVRFLSIEPMLGPIDLTRWMPNKTARVTHRGVTRPDGPKWIIAGGESGPKARPMHPGWARSLRDQCATAGVPFLFKQWGEWLGSLQDGAPHLGEQVINASDAPMRVGKEAAGRLLDGRTHDEFPR